LIRGIAVTDNSPDIFYKVYTLNSKDTVWSLNAYWMAESFDVILLLHSTAEQHEYFSF
jgi:hypothetical protein